MVKGEVVKKIVIIGANAFQNPLILKAKEMGYETHVFAWKDGAIGESTADFFYPISIVEKEEILKECKKIKPDAVVTIASDLANITVQYVSERLGLACNSYESIVISTNKYAMRNALFLNGIPSPKYIKVTVGQDYAAMVQEMQFPLIVKPTDRSGSRGITKIMCAEEIAEAVERSVADSFEKMAIIEEFIDGSEYSCECISYKGEHHILAVTKKYTTGAPHYIETGHIEPAPLDDDIYKKIYEMIPKALTALKIENGASHSEFKVTPEGEIRIVEIGSRMGGDCIGSDLVYLSTGYDFLKMVIETALGKEPTLEVGHPPRCAAIKFIFTSRDYELYKSIDKNNPELIYHVSEIEEIGTHEVVDSSSRFGFFIMCSENEKMIKKILDERERKDNE